MNLIIFSSAFLTCSLALGFKTDTVEWTLSQVKLGHCCLVWLLQNYLKIPAYFSRILPCVIVLCTPDLTQLIEYSARLKDFI